MPTVQETLDAILAALPTHFPGCSVSLLDPRPAEDYRRNAWTFEVSNGEEVRYLFTFTHEFLRDTPPNRIGERIASLRGDTLGYTQAKVVVGFDGNEFIDWQPR